MKGIWKQFTYALIGFALESTICCNHHEAKLSGVWNMETVEVNGVKKEAKEMGYPFLHFYTDGRYTLNMGKAEEQGYYTIDDKQFKLLKIGGTTAAEPMTITRMDSAIMEYSSGSQGNQTKVRLVKHSNN